jgi:hypothetical protein
MQSLVRINGRSLHGIDLLGDLHRAELCADARGRAATDDQRRDDRTAFFDDRKDDDGGKKRFRSEADQAVPGRESKDDKVAAPARATSGSDFEPSSSN